MGKFAVKTKLKSESKQSKSTFKGQKQPNPQTQSTNLMSTGAKTKFVN